MNNIKRASLIGHITFSAIQIKTQTNRSSNYLPYSIKSFVAIYSHIITRIISSRRSSITLRPSNKVITVSSWVNARNSCIASRIIYINCTSLSSHIALTTIQIKAQTNRISNQFPNRINCLILRERHRTTLLIISYCGSIRICPT